MTDGADPTAVPPRAGPAADHVLDLGQLCRVEGVLNEMVTEVEALRSVDDPEVRTRLADVGLRLRDELEATLPTGLADELREFSGWLGDPAASQGELRIGLAQLSGWLDGLIAGVGLALFGSEPTTAGTR